MRGSLGLVIGLVVGAGGMYLALRPPWARGPASAPVADAGVVAQAPPGDAGTKPKKKRRRPSGGGGGQQTTTSGGGPGWGSDSEEFEEPEAPAVVLTAGDRAMEWRGDDTTPGPTKLDMGAGGGESRGLDSGEINNTINAQSGGVRDCIIQSVTGTDLRGEFHVKLLVDGNGRVVKSRVQAPHYTFGKGLLACVQRTAGRMKFPAVGGQTSVELPISVN